MKQTCEYPHWLYRAFDANGVLLYVGCSTYTHARLSAHRRGDGRVGKLLKRYAAKFVVSAAYPDKDAGRAAEIAAIYTEQPLFNIQDRCLPTSFILGQIEDYEAGRPIRQWPGEIHPSVRVAEAVAS